MEEKQAFLTSRPLTPEEVRAITKTSEKFQTFFSNQVRVAASSTEFRLFFGETYPNASGEVQVIDLLSVVLTPTQAKHLAGLLVSVVQKVEAQFGLIPTIQQLQAAQAGQAPQPEPQAAAASSVQPASPADE
jgi:hypothetical protein